MRNYTTWEEDFLSDRCELHGYSDELVAVVDRAGGSWTVTDSAGGIVALRPDKASAVKAAEALLESHGKD